MRWMAQGVAFLFLFSALGCASVVRGDKQKIMFRTDPPGATITIDGQAHTTPVTLELARKDAHEITIAKEGFRTFQFRYEAQWDGASLGNFVMPGGSIGMAADTARGTDRAFFPLRTIFLEPGPADPPLRLYEWEGKLLEEAEYRAAEKARREDRNRFFGMDNY